ncbi:hypothetical protein [Massilibacteroides vaginae]|uniref:hypothetical protein n=1 Tax=Massilibacteroides vaginae TaxID=1673718 RepID=UPI000A1CD812|nr:hypothetical protein [Massilibacteroides vaginae]
MKALIISFFCIILGYSFLFDNKEDVNPSPVMNKSEIKDVDIDVARKVYYLNTHDYFAQKRFSIHSIDSIYFSDRFF